MSREGGAQRAAVIMVACAGGCGKDVPLSQAVCRACVEEVVAWRKTWDGASLLSDTAESFLTKVFQRVLSDPQSV